ncbi:sigma-70 family RNA polymerase sigma factor [Actinoplanes utahensis]|uniref:sigma-70 family RNA polymerase sigma factor n=1 Tax=Actinoplanes utahensis TaxID=1869 RepID=UPI000A04BC02|nr:sigma-70 family RNA polymerase sigma factor [Actinoplanes utahensis]GIF33342.1 RNA polymerase sigma factor [Actinoplanes utahensis]
MTTTAGEDLASWFEQVLVPQSTPGLRRYVRRLLPGDPDRADDIVQETLLRAWRNLTVVAGARSPEAWLSRVARNVAIDWARRHAARPTEVDEDVTATVWEPGEYAYEAVLDRAVLFGALRTLSPLHREALLRVHYQDRTHTEVAGTLGVPPGTVKSRAHYATRELQRILGEQGVTGPAY